jgi:hypothetical protein
MIGIAFATDKGGLLSYRIGFSRYRIFLARSQDRLSLESGNSWKTGGPCWCGGQTCGRYLSSLWIGILAEMDQWEIGLPLGKDNFLWFFCTCDHISRFHEFFSVDKRLGWVGLPTSSYCLIFFEFCGISIMAMCSHLLIGFPQIFYFSRNPVFVNSHRQLFCPLRKIYWRKQLYAFLT